MVRYGELGFWQPDISLFQPLDGGTLHTASEVEHEFGYALSLTRGGDRQARDGGGMIIIAKGFKPSCSRGVRAQVFDKGAVARVSGDELDRVLKGV